MTDALGLIDTNIVIDMLRGYEPAITWMQNNKGSAFALPSLVRMEVVLGTRNKIEQENAIKLLALYPVVYSTVVDSQWAMTEFEKLHLSNQVEIMDCFIAAICNRTGLPIYSRNQKHLGIFSGVVVISPYT